MRSSGSIKSQDLLVLLKIWLWRSRSWTQADLAEALCISQTEICFSLSRLERLHLLDGTRRRVNPMAAAELLIYASPFFFPAELGPSQRGILTAHSHPALSTQFAGGNTIVWPHPEGAAEGRALSPLYPSAPMASQRDAALYEWLALIDAVRLGASRVKKAAIAQIRRNFGIDALK